MIEYRPTGESPDSPDSAAGESAGRIEGRQGTIRELAAHAEVSDAVMRGLVNAGALERVEVDADQPFPIPDPDFAPPQLNEEQHAAAGSLKAAIGQGFDPSCSTGSQVRARPKSISKRSPRRFARAGKSLVLLPEIALTEPFLTRFTARFGCEPVTWHSDLRSSQRRRAWRAIANGEAQVVVGARSSLFLPYPNLGLIVVDEAHEPSFKQEEGVQYHARDVAVMRGHFEEIPVILASATPAIETRHMVEIGRYREFRLTERHGRADLPEIRAIDLTQDPPPRGRWLAPSLVAELEANLAARRAVAAVPQPPRLRAADPVPDLRPPLPMPELHRLDGRAPADAPPRLPPLRPCHAAAEGLPRMRRGGQPGRLRARRRADRRRGRRAVSRGAHRDRHQRHHLVARPRRRVRRARWKPAKSTSSSAPNW